jgi:hypothetical protein
MGGNYRIARKYLGKSKCVVGTAVRVEPVCAGISLISGKNTGNFAFKAVLSVVTD